MSRKCLLAALVALYVLSPAADAPPANACVTADRATADLYLANETTSVIGVYIDGKLAGFCEPMMTLHVRSARLGRVRLVGRCRCDQWGPDDIMLRPERPAKWRFTEASRVTRNH